MINLSASQSAVFVYIAKKVNLAKEIFIESYSFEPDVNTFYDVAFARIPSGGAPVYAVVSLPKNSDRVYITISDGDPTRISKLVSSIQHYGEMKTRLCMGDTVPLSNDSDALSAGWSAALLAPVDLMLDDLPDSAEIQGKKYCFNLVVLINEAERQHKMLNGFEGLMDLFELNQRDIVTFDPGKSR
jgi:hypothetical protein